MDYYEWLNSLIPIFINEIENSLEKKFNYNLNLASGAAKHSKEMHRKEDCFHAPMEFLGDAKFEIAVVNPADYTKNGIEDGLKEIAKAFLKSDNYHRWLVQNNDIGAGIAIKQYPNELQKIDIYFTVRLN